MDFMNIPKYGEKENTTKIGVYSAASITAEAALLYPILILLIMFCLNRTIGMYEAVRQTAESAYIEKTVDTIDIFRKKAQIEKGKDALMDQEK